ncbi:helix-turn-helix domain-containing protein [Arcanobacterium ihumii]|uniref:helix-turn-helix domain-containing protein n=1 Tax=Arcanobacterium ihumii TaxID=2138162 RepID=UPI00389906BD
MTAKQIVGERVNLWLRRRGLTQMSLADKLGITSATMSTKIAGKTSWSVEDLVKTAAFLDVSIADLLPEETVELEKAKSPDSVESRDSGLVAGTGFEPATSGL